MLVCEPVTSGVDSLPVPVPALQREPNASPLPKPPASQPVGDAERREAVPPPASKNPGTGREEQSRPVARPDLIRVLLVDDHTAVRQAFALALSQEAHVEVVGEAGDARTAMDLVRQHQPDVVLMDVNLPGVNGIEATRLLRAEFPRIEVIGLSMYESAEIGAAMRQAGARAYVSKSASYEELLSAIRACHGPDAA